MKCFCSKIITADSKDSVYKYMIEDKGRIVFLGNELPPEYCDVELVDYSNKSIVPAFTDTHQHFASYAMFNAGLNVMEAESNEQISKMLASYINEKNSKVVIAFGASPYSVKEKRLISKHELDRICSDKDVMVIKYDGHACVVNTHLLNRLKKKLENLRGYHFESGEMNQEAFFVISDYITNSVPVIELFRHMQKAADDQAAKGIACIHTVSGVGFAFDLDITLEKIFAKSLNNGFRIRVFPQSLDVKTAIKRNIPRIGGCFACALDGCFGSMDAAMNEPYEGCDDYGVLYYSDEKVIEFCKMANRKGLQIELHAIGDRAFHQAVKAIAAALDDCPRADHRHGIIHACLCDEDDIKKCADYGIQLLVQSAFINWKQEPDSYLESIVGKERASRLNPLKTFVEKGIVISAGSDGPCTDPDPIMWIDRCVNHSNKAEALSVSEALRAATYNGAYATFDEDLYGSLEIGKMCDFALLSDDIYTVEKTKIKDVHVEKLILSGEDYKSCQSSVSRAMLRGIKNKSFRSY